jgi:formylmethanofuran dehydrogenase subunit B
MAAVADSALRRNVACPFCGLACDDLTVAVDGGRVNLREAGCALSRTGFERAPADATPQVAGGTASLDDAIAAAAAILRKSRQPLFAGLATDVAGLRAVMQLAERTGGIVDHLGGDGLFRNLRVIQDSGWMTTTLSEVRNHMDLLLIVGPDPAPLFPRFFERCVAPRQTLFADTRQPPPVVRLGPPADAGAEVRAEEIPCALERLPEAVAALRCLLNGRPLQTAAIAGVPASTLSALAERLKAATYGVVSWIAGAFDFAGAELLTQALADLVRDANQATRCAALPLTGSDNVMGAHQVCSWQSGVPLRTSFDGAAPRRAGSRCPGLDIHLPSAATAYRRPADDRAGRSSPALRAPAGRPNSRRYPRHRSRRRDLPHRRCRRPAAGEAARRRQTQRRRRARPHRSRPRRPRQSRMNAATPRNVERGSTLHAETRRRGGCRGWDRHPASFDKLRMSTDFHATEVHPHPELVEGRKAVMQGSSASPRLRVQESSVPQHRHQMRLPPIGSGGAS